MAATFNTDLRTLKDWLRLQVRDTNLSEAYLQDETYEALLAASSTLEALAQAAQSVINELLRDPSKYSNQEGTSFDYSQQVEYLEKLKNDARGGRITVPGQVRVPAAGADIQTSLSTVTLKGFRPS